MNSLVRVIVLTPAGHPDPSMAVAAVRAGFLGVVNGEIGSLPVKAVEHLAQHARGPFGLKIPALDAASFALVKENAPRGLQWLILDADDVLAAPALIERLAELGVRTLVELVAWDERLKDLTGHAGLIVKGHEAGGRVGEETSYILLQKALARQSAPVFVRGGVGLHSGAAVMAGGAAGLVLDDQLLLLKESPLDAAARGALKDLTGLETALIGPDEIRWRVFEKPGFRHIRQLRKTISGLNADETARTLTAAFGWADPQKDVMPIGQGIAFAAQFAAKYGTVGRLAHALVEESDRRPREAATLDPFGPGHGVAASHGTTYPIVQGPMTRVSDVAGFAQSVAEAGGLPMLALALMRPEQVETLLAETAERLKGKPWGVGLLGFAPAELIAGQMGVARKHAPKFALIAGGRPDQAQGLEAEGVSTYLHVPSPRLLTLFLDQGARRFVFEGRECGGHVGPLASLVLWDVMVSTLLEHVRDPDTAAGIHLLFAGGIHDARSSAIVAALVAPLAALGVKVGMLMGSAYLFTREIVESGAIVKGFQEEALACERTVCLETGPGHASRAAVNPFADHFLSRRIELEKEGRSADEIREDLESFTLGRLRVASKGTERADDKLKKVPEKRQKLEGMYMIGQVATLRDQVVSVADVHRAVSEDAHALLAGIPAPHIVQRVTPKAADVAIVGIAGVFPKANNVRDYWENILDSVDGITEIPQERWDWRIYFDEDRTAPDKIYSRWGGFLDEVLFDPMRFGIPPNSIKAIDPLQLMTLEVVRECLADAGLEGIEGSRERISVILGASGGAGDVGAQYAVRSEMPRFLGGLDQEAAKRLPTWTEDSFAGILLNVAAGRAANRFDMGGVNFTVDAACASSLAAIYQAVLELETGRSDLVVAGGVDTVQGPFGYLCFSKTQALSPRGRCSTFDASADGIVISEGIAMVALKRLADAERDGDRVYAVLKGVAGSSDGRAKSMTAPHPGGQIRAMRRAYEMAGYSPNTVGLFEAHGTGTVAGDTAELETVTRLLTEAGAAPRQSAIGSVKTLIGHTKATAGVAGLIKATLATHHGVLPPHGRIDKPNKTLSDPRSPLHLIGEPQPWITDDSTGRRASVSAFGFGGTNFHVTLESYEDKGLLRANSAPRQRWPYELLLWRGADKAALANAVRTTADLLAAAPSQPVLRDLAATLAANAPATGLTATLVVGRGEAIAERIAKLANHLAGEKDPLPPGAAFSAEPLLASGGKPAFVFPGQGSPYPGMMRDVAVLFPEMRDALAQADTVTGAAMVKAGVPNGHLSGAIYPPALYDQASQEAALAQITRTEIAQPALGAIEAGLLRVLDSLGVKGGMAAGHSYGELVALHAAGVLDFDALMQASVARATAMVDTAAGGDLGTMLAVRGERKAVEAAVAGISGLVVANHNAPKQTILSGTREAIAAARAKLDAAKISNQQLQVGAAFHSPIVAGARRDFAAFLDTVTFGMPAMPVFANGTAGRYPDGVGAMRETLAAQLTQSVEFVAEIEAMYEAGARVFLTVGPKGAHAGMIRQILGDRPHRAIAIDDESGGLKGLLAAIGALLAEGATPNLARLFEGRDCRKLDARTLAPAQRSAVPANHMWWLSGSGARRVGQPPVKPLTIEDVAARTANPPPQIAAPTSPGRDSAPQPAPKKQGDARQQPTTGPRRMDDRTTSYPVEPAEADPAYASAGDNVLAEFQATMQRFLATQEAVMMAYLGGTAQPQAARPAAPPAMPRPVAAAPRPAAPRPQPPRPAPAPVAARPAVAPVAAPPIAVASPAPAATNGGAVNGHATAPTAAIGKPALTDLLLGLVEERTGYPRDMLGMDQKLEADLGIDSIKRVEIVGALVKALPPGAIASTDGLGEKLNACKTLQGMVDCLDGAMGSGGTAPPPAAAGSATRPFDQAGSDTAAKAAGARPPRYLMVAHAEELPVGPITLPAGLYVLTDDGRGVAAALAKRIAAAGGQAHVLSAADPEGDVLPATSLPVKGFIHLAALGSRSLPLPGAMLEWRSEIVRNEALPHRLLKRFGASLADSGRVLLASSLGGQFGRGTKSTGVSLQGGGPGLAKSAEEEWPKAIVKAVDLDPGQSSDQQAAQLMAELLAGGGRREVGYPAGKRTVFRTVETVIDTKTPKRDALGKGAVILATGGARGITAETLRPLAKPGVTLVLAGRTPLPGDEDAAFAKAKTPTELRAALIGRARAAGVAPKPVEIERNLQSLLRDREIRANLRDLEAAGAKVLYRIADVSDPAAAAGLVASLRTEFGRLDGIVHGAGVIEDKLIVDKDPDSWMRVVETKAHSALALASAVDAAHLKFFVMFGSVAGRYGNSGQSDYAAANELLNRLGHQLRALWPESVKIAVLNWGPWLGTSHGSGMVSDDTKRKFETKGVGLVTPDGGTAAMLDEILHGAPQDVEIVIGQGPWEKHESDVASVFVAAPEAPAIASANPLRVFPLVAGAEIGPGARGGRLLKRTLSLKHDMYLEHHRLEGIPVLPAAVALEIAAEAAGAVWPNWQVAEVSELRLLGGLRFEDDKPRDIEIQVLGSEHGDASGFGASVEIRSPGGRVHYRVALKITDALPQAEPLGWSVSPAAATFDARHAYRDILIHGPCFQVMTKLIGLDDSGIVADIMASKPSEFIAGAAPDARWLFDPALVDAAAQLAWVWGCVRRNAAALPNRFGRVRRFAGAGAPARMLFALQPELPEHQVLADFAVVDAEGRPVFVIEEVESTANAALNRICGYAGEIRV